VGAWLALTMIVMACPPFEWIVDLILLAAFALWFIASNHAGATRTWIGLRRGSTIVLVVLLLVLTAAEFSHRTMPVIAGKPSDHLIVIGDSISSGIDPRIPAWPLVLQQTSGVSVRNLARPRAQSREELAMAEKLTPEDRVVLVGIGGNDLLMGVPSDEFGRSLEALLSKVTAPGRTVVMFELPLLPTQDRVWPDSAAASLKIWHFADSQALLHSGDWRRKRYLRRAASLRFWNAPHGSTRGTSLDARVEIASNHGQFSHTECVRSQSPHKLESLLGVTRPQQPRRTVVHECPLNVGESNLTPLPKCYPNLPLG
jgi:hypothetical protein